MMYDQCFYLLRTVLFTPHAQAMAQAKDARCRSSELGGPRSRSSAPRSSCFLYYISYLGYIGIGGIDVACSTYTVHTPHRTALNVGTSQVHNSHTPHDLQVQRARTRAVSRSLYTHDLCGSAVNCWSGGHATHHTHRITIHKMQMVPRRSRFSLTMLCLGCPFRARISTPHVRRMRIASLET